MPSLACLPHASLPALDRRPETVSLQFSDICTLNHFSSSERPCPQPPWLVPLLLIPQLSLSLFLMLHWMACGTHVPNG